MEGAGGKEEGRKRRDGGVARFGLWLIQYATNREHPATSHYSSQASQHPSSRQTFIHGC